MHNLSKDSERSIAILIIIICILLTFTLYIRGRALAPPGQYFIGHAHPEDTDTYIAKMLTGAEEGIFLYRNRLTTEEHARAPLFHFYLIAGGLSRLFNINFISMYHLARVFFAFALLFYLYRESRLFFAKPLERLIFLIILCFSGGFGGITEANTFRSIVLFPHFVAGMLFLSLYIISFYRLHLQSGSWKYATLCSISVLLTGIIHPWNLAVLAAVSLAIMGITKWRKEWRLTSEIVWQYVIIFISAIVITGMHIHTYMTNEVFRRIASQNVLYVQGLESFAGNLGLMWLGAAAGTWIAWRKRKSSPMIIPAVWFVTTCLMITLPLSFQRRLFEGLHIPAAILSAYFLFYSAQYLAKKKSWPVKKCVIGLSAGFLILTVPANLSMLSFPREMDFIFVNQFPPLEVREDMTWVDENMPRGANVMASCTTGHFLVRYTMVDAFIVHKVETMNYEKKRQLMHEFYSERAAPAFQRRLLSEYDIDYVIHDRYSPFIKDFRPLPEMEIVYRNGPFVVYKFPK